MSGYGGPRVIIRDDWEQEIAAQPAPPPESDTRIGPKPLRSNWPWWLAGEQYRPGAASPSVAKATLTRQARARRRAVQLYRRGHKGLKALALAIHPCAFDE